MYPLSRCVGRRSAAQVFEQVSKGCPCGFAGGTVGACGERCGSRGGYGSGRCRWWDGGFCATLGGVECEFLASRVSGSLCVFLALLAALLALGGFLAFVLQPFLQSEDFE